VHRYGGFNPDRGIGPQWQHNAAFVVAQGSSELAAPEDLADFGHNRLRERDDILVPCL
jgi:hypothetical protein